MLNACFPFGTLELGHLAGRACQCAHPPNKISGHWVSSKLYMCAQKLLVHGLHWERIFGSWLLLFSNFYPMRLFLSVIFLSIFFTLVDHSCEYDYMLSPASPPTESSNLGVNSETPNK